MGVPRNRADHKGHEFCTDESRCSRPGCHLGQTDSGRRLRHNERYIIRSPALDADTPAIPQFLDGVSIPLPCGRNWVLRKVCLCGRAAVCVVEGAQITGSGTRSKFTPATGRIFCLTGTSRKIHPCSVSCRLTRYANLCSGVLRAEIVGVFRLGSARLGSARLGSARLGESLV